MLKRPAPSAQPAATCAISSLFGVLLVDGHRTVDVDCDSVSRPGDGTVRGARRDQGVRAVAKFQLENGLGSVEGLTEDRRGDSTVARHPVEPDLLWPDHHVNSTEG